MVQGWGSFANSLAPSLGMLAGGFVAEQYGWRVLFSAPVVPVTIAFAAALQVLPDDRAAAARMAKLRPGSRPRFDFEGTAVLALATTLLLLGVNWVAAWPLLGCA